MAETKMYGVRFLPALMVIALVVMALARPLFVRRSAVVAVRGTANT